MFTNFGIIGIYYNKLLNKVQEAEKDKEKWRSRVYKEMILASEVQRNFVPKRNIDIYPVSAIEGFFVDELIEIFKDKLPLSPPFFPKDQFTDRPERFFVNESIREQILIHYDKEVPYSVEVITEDFKESPKIIKIRSLILVERESQKGILIGHKGSALKRVATKARNNLEKFFGKKIFLEVFIKVKKNWRNDPSSLKKFGYN